MSEAVGSVIPIRRVDLPLRVVLRFQLNLYRQFELPENLICN